MIDFANSNFALNLNSKVKSIKYVLTLFSRGEFTVQ